MKRALALLVLLGGCCPSPNIRVADKLEAFVLFGFRSRTEVRPEVALAGNSPPTGIAPGESLYGFLREVFCDHLDRGIKARRIELAVVDERGAPAHGPELDPREVQTDSDGFATFAFLAHGPGTFRVVAMYDDKRAVSLSYSPVIIVSGHAH